MIGVSIILVTLTLILGSVNAVDLRLVRSALPVSSKNSDFAVSLYKRVVEKAGVDRNAFMSPLSVSTALAMAYAGAKENTKTQMAQVLRFELLEEAALYEGFKILLDVFNSKKNNYTLGIANRIFGRKNAEYVDKFVKDNSKYFHASPKALDFESDPDGARKYINGWVANKTKEKINNLLPSGTINRETALVLVNAIYFKALWQYPFAAEDTKKEPFHTSNNGKVSIDMMSAEGIRYKYGESAKLGCRIIEIPYRNNEVSMFVLLPNKVGGLSDMENHIDYDSLETARMSMKYYTVDLKMPKFKFSQQMSLKQILGSMGIQDLFNPKKADLSAMMKGHDLYVTEVVHKSFVDVNEKGTEAAGSTGVAIGITGAEPPKKFVVDRPFMFYIREKNTGAILFMGRMATKPAENGEPNVGTFASEYEGKPPGNIAISTQINVSSFVVTILLISSIW